MIAKKLAPAGLGRTRRGARNASLVEATVREDGLTNVRRSSRGAREARLRKRHEANSPLNGLCVIRLGNGRETPVQQPCCSPSVY